MPHTSPTKEKCKYNSDVNAPQGNGLYFIIRRAQRWQTIFGIFPTPLTRLLYTL